MLTKSISGFLISVGLVIILSLGAVWAQTAVEPGSSPGRAMVAGGVPTAIQVQFFNPLVNKESFYIGELWHYPKFNLSQMGGKLVAEARAKGLDAQGKLSDVSPDWKPSDPQMVQVSPPQGHQVKITVLKAGESSLRVTLGGISREITIKARYSDGIMHVDFSQ